MTDYCYERFSQKRNKTQLGRFRDIPNKQCGYGKILLAEAENSNNLT